MQNTSYGTRHSMPSLKNSNRTVVRTGAQCLCGYKRQKITHFRYGGNGWFCACWGLPKSGNAVTICGRAVLQIAKFHVKPHSNPSATCFSNSKMIIASTCNWLAMTAASVFTRMRRRYWRIVCAQFIIKSSGCLTSAAFDELFLYMNSAGENGFYGNTVSVGVFVMGIDQQCSGITEGIQRGIATGD